MATQPNIQLFPSPLFYICGTAGKYLFRGAREPVAGTVTQSAASIVSANAMNSNSYALTEGTILNTSFIHGLGHTPGYLRLVLLCTANDSNSGILAGQEIDAWAFFDNDQTAQPFSVGADSTKIYLEYNGDIGNPYIIIWWAGARKFMSSMSNFSLKVYWQ